MQYLTDIVFQPQRFSTGVIYSAISSKLSPSEPSVVAPEASSYPH